MRMLVLADPVNPTGGVFAPEDLEQIAWWAKKHDVLVSLPIGQAITNSRPSSKQR